MKGMKKVSLWLCSVLAMLVVIGSMTLKVSAATYSGVTSDDKKWKVWINTSTGRCSIKPAKAGVSGVSSGEIIIPAKIQYNKKSYDVTGIAPSAYSGNTKVTNVNLGKAVNLIVISSNSFKGCTSLEHIKLIENTKLTTIGDSAFYGDKKLVGNTKNQLYLPSRLSKIGVSAFEGCSKIKVINAETCSAISTIGSNAFKGIASTHTTYTYNASKYNLFKNTYKIGGTVISKNYVVTYNNNTSPAGKTTQTLKYGSENSKFLANTAFRKTGYAISSWNTKADGTGTKYTPGASISKITPTGAINLYARWTPITYKVRFNANGGQGSQPDQSMTYDNQRGLSINIFTKTGYVFSGWSLTANGSKTYNDGASVINLSSTSGAVVNLYAVWTPIQYRINFTSTRCWTNKNENIQASVTYDKTYVTASYDTTVTLPQNIVRCKGYEFKGWYYNGSVVTSIKNATTVNNGSVTVQAKMEPIRYKVIVDGNHGVVTNGDATGPSVVYGDVTYASTFNLSGITCSREGYTLVGWAKSPNGDADYDIDEAILNLADANIIVSLYAVWKPINYNIKFDANAPEGIVAAGYQPDVQCVYDKEKKLGLCNFSCPGYRFTGWNTEPDGSGQQYQEGELVKNLIATPETYVLYAQWTPVKYTIRFEVGEEGEGTPPDSIECEYGKPFTIPEFDSSKMNRDGYHFVKWCTEVNESDTSKTFEAGETYDISLATEDGEEVVLYGIWVCGKYIIHFETGTQSTVRDKELTYSDNERFNISIPEPDLRSGYYFDSWNTAVDGSGKRVDDKIRPKADYQVLATGVPSADDPYVTVITLYAQWKPNQYKVMLDIVTKEGVASLPANTRQEIPVYYGSTFYSKLPTPTLRGYDFKGWKTPSGTKITSETEYRKAGDITIYPIWQIKKYNITFDCKGGTLGGKSSVTKTYNWRTELGNHVPGLSQQQKRDNKIFLGWYYLTGSTKHYVTAASRVDKSLTLYADIRRPNYNVKFDLGYRDRSGRKVVKTVSYAYKSTLGSKSAVGAFEKKSGYLFDGWYYKKGNKIYKAVRGDKIVGSLTLTARWKKLKVDKNGSTLDNRNKVVKVSWNNDEKFVSLQYRYAKNTAGLKSARVYAITKKRGKPLGQGLKVPYSLGYIVVQVRAKYKDSKGQYTYTDWATFCDVCNKRETVTFNPNGGKIGNSTSIRTVAFVKGKTLKTSPSFCKGQLYTPKRNGYKFDGWYYKKAGRERKVAINTRLAAGTRVYAKWKR